MISARAEVFDHSSLQSRCLGAYLLLTFHKAPRVGAYRAVHVNELKGGAKTSAYMLQYDSVHLKWGDHQCIESEDGKSFTVDGRKVKRLRHRPPPRISHAVVVQPNILALVAQADEAGVHRLDFRNRRRSRVCPGRSWAARWCWSAPETSSLQRCSSRTLMAASSALWSGAFHTPC
eukprot:1610299-Rhodomonas_salina.1